MPFFYQAGTCVNAAGETVHGIMTCFLTADDASRAAGNGFGQLAGGYLFKMFGLPAAAFAIAHSAKPENRAKIVGIMASAALTSFLTGITEPIEFSFLFVAPVLYAIHALLAGLAYVLTNMLGVVHGHTFSNGFIDFVVQSPRADNMLLLVGLGLVYAVIYYVVFTVVIRAMNLKTRVVKTKLPKSPLPVKARTRCLLHWSPPSVAKRTSPLWTPASPVCVSV